MSASWNPQPSFPGPSWSGTNQLVSRQQFISSINAIYNYINTQDFSTLNVSSLIVPDWISTSVLYVSDIQGATLDISGITINENGMFNAPIVSLSTMNFKGIDLGGVNVSFDLGLGQAVGGLLGGLGALVGGGLIAVGTGAGLAIQGAETGIATMVAGRPSNYITNNTFETINFTSQLQVSTLGNAEPIYSTIFRTVSSSSANQVPGPEMFISTFFQPNQICIRSVSDPFNLITGDSNLNTSTIQSFGQWVPLVGLEPDNIQANSVSTNQLSTSELYASAGQVDVLVTDGTLVKTTLQVGQVNDPATLALPYESEINLQIGAVSNARIVGDLNLLWTQSDGDVVWSKPGATNTTPIQASLSMGTGAGESVLTVSSINSSGGINANTGIFQNLIANSLTVISSFSTTFTQSNVNFISTAIIDANQVNASLGLFSTLFVSSFNALNFTGTLGNSNGPFDINRVDNIISTAYDQVSSLTQNILNYSLNQTVQDEALVNIGDGPLGVTYSVTPQNIGQWASTILYWTGLNPGSVDFGWVGQWGVTPGQSGAAAPNGATLDIWVDPNNANGGTGPFYITENSNNAYPFNTSTFFQVVPSPGQLNPNTYRFRATLPPIVGGTRSGWWQFSNGFVPYATSNNNTFQIFQDINDTFITASDRLHLRAGDILVDGSLSLSNFQTQNIQAANASFTNLFTSNSFLSSVTATGYVSSPSFVNQYTFTGSLNAPSVTSPLQFGYTMNSTDFTNIRFLTVPSRGPNMFNSANLNEWNNSVYTAPTGTNTNTGPPQIYLGDLVKTSGYAYSGRFWINNITSPPLSFPISIVRNGGWLSSIGFAPTTGTGYTLIQTTDGANFTISCNVTNPQGAGGYTYSNGYNVSMNESNTTINCGMPLIETVPSKVIQANKITLAANQIRTITYNSPSYQPREAGFELTSYFDANVIFSGSQSDAINNIISPAGSLGYAVIAWSPQLWFGRIRTQSLGIQGFEIEAVVSAISGTFGDLIWASHRYLNVNQAGDSDIREIYFMVPVNYMTYQNLIGPY